MTDTFDIDPLEAAFANPKAGKKLKPGESLPGMEGTSQHNDSFNDVMIEPDAALSSALDDAFSNPNFGSDRASQPVSEPVYVEDTAVIEAKLARDLDDAFANPKVGNKIEEGTSLSDSGLTSAGFQSTGLEMPRTDDLQFGETPVKSGGMFGPKFLVIAMVLGAVAIAVVMGGVETTSSTPTVIRLD